MAGLDGILASLLPDRAAASLARRVLRAMGIGAGTRAAGSGEMAALAAVVHGAEPVIFDVGANVGDWSTGALARFPGAELHVFEPSAAHLDRLRPALGDRPRAINAVALGREAGTATLYKDADVTGLASLTRRDLSHKGIEMDRTETVEIDTLDAYAARHGIDRIDYLKIDVEGHELDVLQGAAGLLERGAIGAIQIEFGGCNVDTRTFLRDFHRLFEAHGFAMHRIRPNGGLAPVGPYREFLEQFATTNYVALPARGGR